MIIGFTVLTAALRLLAFYGFCAIAAKRLHNKMLKSVIVAKMRFFDLNPPGRIINRFSKDTANIDDALPVALLDFIQYGTKVVGAICFTIYSNYLIILPVIPVAVYIVYMRSYYMRSSREAMRIEGLC